MLKQLLRDHRRIIFYVVAAAGVSGCTSATLNPAPPPGASAVPTTLGRALKPLAGVTDSQYLQTAGDTQVSGAQTTILSTAITGGRYVYLESDGRLYPTTACLADLFITVDGVKVSNDSLIDWRQSISLAQHSFNVIAAVNLAAGQHTITLSATGSGSFQVGARANLSVLANPATTVVQYGLPSDTGVLSFNTAGIQEGQPLPKSSFGKVNISTTGQPIVALLSGRTYNGGYNCCYGDPLWNISIDGISERNAYSDWSDNDINPESELQAPMFTHAYFDGVSAGNHSISADASELPYTPPLVDDVEFRIGAGTQLIALSGGMTVSGRGSLVNDQYHRLDYLCIGTSSGSPGCPPVNTDVTVVNSTVTVPAGDSGVVFFAAKSRVQADSSDRGGYVQFWIDVDGVQRGSIGVQALNYPYAVSTRTIGASYLAAGTARLTSGAHQVSVHAMATGTFIHLSLTKDLPLIWFD